jgi:hypothetical protein
MFVMRLLMSDGRLLTDWRVLIHRRPLMACSLWMQKTGDGVVGDQLGDLLRRLRAFGPEPVRGPVQRAKERARRDGRIGGAQQAAPDAARHERADAAFVPIAFADDPRAQARRQGGHLEMRRGSLDLVYETQHVGHGDVAQPRGERTHIAARRRQRAEQAIERAVLAEEQQLVLPAEVVIEVAGRQIGRDRDVAHAGRREAAGAEHAGGRAHDLDTTGVGAP